MLRQYELIEKVRSYDPDADEGLINRAYVFSMKAHGSQMRASGDPYFSHPIEVAGILTETSSQGEKADHVIVGIGVNLNLTAFPDDLSKIATSLRLLRGRPVDRFEGAVTLEPWRIATLTFPFSFPFSG